MCLAHPWLYRRDTQLPHLTCSGSSTTTISSELTTPGYHGPGCKTTPRDTGACKSLPTSYRSQDQLPCRRCISHSHLRTDDRQPCRQWFQRHRFACVQGSLRSSARLCARFVAAGRRTCRKTRCKQIDTCYCAYAHAA